MSRLLPLLTAGLIVSAAFCPAQAADGNPPPPPPPPGATDGHHMPPHDMPFGRPAGADVTPTRVIAVQLTDDMRFQNLPASIKNGETIRFDISNSGSIAHEFVIGDKRSQDMHAKMMQSDGKMMQSGEMMMNHGGGGHGPGGGPGHPPAAVMVDAGKTATLSWTFATSLSEVIIACHVPGHAEAGMTATIPVTP